MLYIPASLMALDKQSKETQKSKSLIFSPSITTTIMKAMAQMVSILLLLTLLLNESMAFSSIASGFHVDLAHIHSHDNRFTKLQLHQRAIQQSKQRIAATFTANKQPSSASLPTGVQSSVHYDSSAYKMELAIGTPPVPVAAVIDTASSYIWTQCHPCTECLHQPGTVYEPSKSSTFSKAPCNASLCNAFNDKACSGATCSYSGYSGSSSIKGIIAMDTFTFGTIDGRQTSHSDVGFACVDVNQRSDAIAVVGLSKGPFSLTSQLGVTKFSYCLTPFRESKRSFMHLGSPANLNGSSSIPLLRSAEPFYFLALKGITIGTTRLPIPEETFDVDEFGFGGMAVDTSSPHGFLHTVAFRMVKEELSALLQLPIVDPLFTNDELCFLMSSNSSVKLPEFVLHFDEGTDLELPPSNYMIHDPTTGFLCFTMMEQGGISVLGNYQQQNMHVVYDLDAQKVSINPAQCDAL